MVHLMAHFKTLESTNWAIRDGLIIARKRVWGRRMKKELKRCLKCQILNTSHFSAGCSGQETCRTCGEEHHTAECMEDNQEKCRCANCKVLGNALWDRTCPKFMQAARKLEERDPESTYKFFPTDEPWTWEQDRDAGTQWNSGGGGEEVEAQQGRRWNSDTIASRGEQPSGPADGAAGEWDPPLTIQGEQHSATA